MSCVYVNLDFCSVVNVIVGQILKTILLNFFLISGKTASSNAAPAASNGGSGYGGGPPMPNGMGLGGLFAGGMPKLKPTKNRLGMFKKTFHL